MGAAYYHPQRMAPPANWVDPRREDASRALDIRAQKVEAYQQSVDDKNQRFSEAMDAKNNLLNERIDHAKEMIAAQTELHPVMKSHYEAQTANELAKQALDQFKLDQTARAERDAAGYLNAINGAKDLKTAHYQALRDYPLAAASESSAKPIVEGHIKMFGGEPRLQQKEEMDKAKVSMHTNAVLGGTAEDTAFDPMLKTYIPAGEGRKATHKQVTYQNPSTGAVETKQIPVDFYNRLKKQSANEPSDDKPEAVNELNKLLE